MIRRRNPIRELQAAVFTILSENQEYHVYDGVPDDAVLPYDLISDYKYEVVPDKTTDIVIIRLEIEAWSGYDGKDEVNKMIADATQVLTAWPIDLSDDGFKVIDQDVKSGEGNRHGDYYYGILTLEVTIQNTGPP
ncbi:tail completion protein gp17 [Sporomusa malonica]|uniref:Uncharacterized protein n=1 Tax=Sporomusa malonica TaxID=112901 RepID=A0A1W2AR53_9FIRM|nr:DUF3168 domain-containing protein [Sporomusa malonica]SMC63229.1 Protein of unknown function [Sporomusa malonica]